MGTPLETRPDVEVTVGDGFRRHPTTGAPFVSDPDGGLVQQGKRKGEIRRLMYGRPSSYFKQIENTYNLNKWSERMGLLGLVVNSDIYDAAAWELADLNPETREFKDKADVLVRRAKEAAKANLAADRGTHTHAITEDFDEGRDWIERAKAGEAFGLPLTLQAAFVRSWERMLDELGLEILATEASCVCDGHKVAGTLDRIVRAVRTVTIGSQVIPAGCVFVLDIKTGQLHTYGDGSPDFKYWVGYAVQAFTYADSVPYDTETETRGEWPWPVSTDVALIAHLDVRHALETGEAICRPIIVDLAAGRLGAELCRQAKNYERMAADIFTLGGDVVVVQETPAVVTDSNGFTHDAARFAAGCRRDELFRRYEALNADRQQAFKNAGVDGKDLDAVEELLTQLEQPAPPLLTPEQQARRMLTERRAPDEGEPIHLSFPMLEAHYKHLTPEDRAWLGRLSGEAGRNAVSFHGKEAHTVRRFEILRALINLAEHSDNDDDLIRTLVASVVDADWPLMPAFPTGQVVGALDATEATRFSSLVDSWCLGELVVKVSEDGTMRLVDA